MVNAVVVVGVVVGTVLDSSVVLVLVDIVEEVLAVVAIVVVGVSSVKSETYVQNT